jgi:hypothetical protein
VIPTRSKRSGRPASGRPQDNDDPLSRRDMGLEFLNVTNRVAIAAVDTRRNEQVYRIRNTGGSPIDTHLLVIVRDLTEGVEMTNASGRTSGGELYLRLFLPNGILGPTQSIDVALRFKRHGQPPLAAVALTLLSGPGNPYRLNDRRMAISRDGRSLNRGLRSPAAKSHPWYRKIFKYLDCRTRRHEMRMVLQKSH